MLRRDCHAHTGHIGQSEDDFHAAASEREPAAYLPSGFSQPAA